MVEKIKCEDLYTADDLIKRVINKQSDFWVSTDGYDNIQGCIIIGFGEMPRGKGICAEAIEGKFDFSIVTPVVEKYYKKLGFKFLIVSSATKISNSPKNIKILQYSKIEELIKNLFKEQG